MSVNADNPGPVEIALEENLRVHAIGAEILAPFVIERFNAGGEAAFAEISVAITGEDGQEQTRAVRLLWNPQSAFAKPSAMQERVKTEWGAVGVACALIPPLLGKRILSDAEEGEGFDYRMGDGLGEWGLEISGTLSESESDLRERHRQKVRQLRENPPHLRGYVFIVGFTLREILVSFHLPQWEELA